MKLSKIHSAPANKIDMPLIPPKGPLCLGKLLICLPTPHQGIFISQNMVFEPH